MAQNRAAAQAEADKLAGAASLPPGAVRVSAAPAALPLPALGIPITTQLIDTVRYYRVPTSEQQVLAWFRHNSQHGLTQSGTGSIGGPAGPVTYGFQYDVSPTPHWSWGTADLQIGMASQGTAATAVRVDGVAQWIDPSPAPDQSTGPTIRVTVAGGCPASDAGAADVSNVDATDLDHALLPESTPTAALQCTYDGANGNPFTLKQSRRLDPAQAAAVATAIRALPLGSTGSGPRNCPMDDSRASVLVFSYPGRDDVDLWQHTSGCSSTDNGHIRVDGV